MAKYLERKRVEARLLGCVDKIEDLVVNRHAGYRGAGLRANDGICERRYSIPRAILLVKGRGCVDVDVVGCFSRHTGLR